MGDHAMDVDGSQPAQPAPDAAAPGVIELHKHTRILNDVWITVAPDILAPDFLDGMTDMSQLVDMMCVCQLTAFTDVVYPKLGGDVSLFAYCVESYHRARACSRLVVKNQERKDLLATLESFMVKYAINALQQKGLFESVDRNNGSLIIEQLVKGGFGDEFLQRFVTELTMSDPGDLERTFAPVFIELQALTAEEAHKNMLAPMRYLTPLAELVWLKPLRATVVELPTWKPPCYNGANVQMLTWLGPLLSASECPGRFANPETGPFKDTEKPYMTPEIQTSFDLLRKQSASYRQTVHAIVYRLLSSKDSKTRVLEWIASAIELNGDRTKIQNQMRDTPDESLADDGFMLNLCAVMLGLCDKYTSPTDKNVWPPKFDKIDPFYLRSPASRINIKDDTLLGESKAPAHHLLDSLPPSHGDTRGAAAAPPSLDAVPASPGHGAPNFITESFFMTLRALHVGVLPTMARYKMSYLMDRSEFNQLNRRISQLEKKKEEGALSGIDQIQLARISHRVAVLTRRLFSMMTHLGDEAYLTTVLNFYAFVCAWLLHLVDPEDKGLPLSASVPAVFAALPEHIVEDAADFMSFAAHVCPDAVEALLPNRVESIARFFTTFIGDQTYIRNPYVLSKFVGVMAEFTPEMRERHRGRSQSEHSYFFQVVISEKTSVQHLAPALMRFFVNMEETDFYERGNKRRQVATIMKTLWKSDAHRAALVRDSHSAEFGRFIMLLINDTVELFDSAREQLGTHLASLEETQQPEFASRPQEEIDEINQRMQQYESGARYYFEFGVEMLNIFTYLTTEIVEPVLADHALVERLARLLNFNLVDMTTKAKDPARCAEYVKVNMEPANLILKLVQVYLQVSGVYGRPPPPTLHVAFLQEVARDGRSFRPDVFRDAMAVVKATYPAKQDALDMMDKFTSLIDRFEDVFNEDAALDQDLGDIPPEFLDPIMDELMTDPVRLPASGQIMDRKHIHAHLLSQPRDPFNRAPLTVEDLISEDELRERIATFVREKRAQAKARAGAGSSDAMAE
eukprot:m.100223 g.100223  ORF g.100223 m.100223 type:complete len:1025 (+) comp10337_c0_seq3:236-3310(+)